MNVVTMHDADNPYDIPRDAEMVAGYIDGSRTTWKAEWWGWFTRAILVTISAVGARWDADLFDVEPNCIWPPENVLPLVVTARTNGRWPAVYCNQLNHWPYVRQMFRMRGIEEPPYIVANYDGVAVIPDGAVGKQYKHPPQIGKHYDLSVVNASWTPGRKANQMQWTDPITRIPGDVIAASERIAWTNYYAGEAARDAAAALAQSQENRDRIGAVEESVNVLTRSVAALSETCQEILRRLDEGTAPTVDVEAVARRAKQLAGEDLLDAETDTGR